MTTNTDLVYQEKNVKMESQIMQNSAPDSRGARLIGVDQPGQNNAYIRTKALVGGISYPYGIDPSSTALTYGSGVKDYIERNYLPFGRLLYSGASWQSLSSLIPNQPNADSVIYPILIRVTSNGGGGSVGLASGGNTATIPITCMAIIYARTTAPLTAYQLDLMTGVYSVIHDEQGSLGISPKYCSYVAYGLL